ncbi:DUF427 domain-containing protein [Streptomyces hoynatensis]|uniref:DUF427 domain-containing protein n=1 Tax=Streptomyces hoynatensis TaxID=1141874 RepID=A0A3A9ZBW5_9ACTN|nr:DUF427 domain-containing protein [Streptomyces hoynatensis]RKN44837.1 DUF427 domain-containing protein [Streptomyces hoynatensis]
MNDYPRPVTRAGHVEPVPRRIRAFLGAHTLFDTVRARYVWEIPHYPQYYVPVEDVDAGLLVDEDREERQPLGTARVHGLRAGEETRPGAARVFTKDAAEGLAGLVRFDWEAPDAWFEEDEEIFVHPRSPYTRVDALRSTRNVRVELGGVTLAESSAPVLVFETGLPARYYLERTDVDFSLLVPSKTRTACPYKGRTSAYWSVRAGGRTHEDLAWCYDFPTRQLLPIAGLVCFYSEKTDTYVDGRLLPRPE